MKNLIIIDLDQFKKNLNTILSNVNLKDSEDKNIKLIDLKQAYGDQNMKTCLFTAINVGILESKKITANPLFREYLINAKSNFIDEVQVQDWNTKLRTTAGDMIIAYDQILKQWSDITDSDAEQDYIYHLKKAFVSGFYHNVKDPESNITPETQFDYWYNELKKSL